MKAAEPTTLDYRRKAIPCKLRREDKGTHAIWRITPPAGDLRQTVIERSKGQEVLVLIDPAPIEFDGAHVAAVMRAAAEHHELSVGECVEVRPDRAYFVLEGDLIALLLNDWRQDSAKLARRFHGPPEIYITTNTEGYERPTWRVPYELVGSWRSRTTPSLQVTIWKGGDADERVLPAVRGEVQPDISGNRTRVHVERGSGGDATRKDASATPSGEAVVGAPGAPLFVCELDIDYKCGLGHVVKEVIPNAVLRRKTDPIIAAQLAAFMWPDFTLPFDIEPGA